MGAIVRSQRQAETEPQTTKTHGSFEEAQTIMSPHERSALHTSSVGDRWNAILWRRLVRRSSSHCFRFSCNCHRLASHNLIEWIRCQCTECVTFLPRTGPPVLVSLFPGRWAGFFSEPRRCHGIPSSSVPLPAPWTGFPSSLHRVCASPYLPPRSHDVARVSFSFHPVRVRPFRDVGPRNPGCG